MAQINSEQDLTDGLEIIMGRPFATHDRQRKIRVASLMIGEFKLFLQDEIVKDELKATPKGKIDFYEDRLNYAVLLDWETTTEEQIVIEICVLLGIAIPADPVFDFPYIDP